jgi:hypothetical protein
MVDVSFIDYENLTASSLHLCRRTETQNQGIKVVFYYDYQVAEYITAKLPGLLGSFLLFNNKERTMNKKIYQLVSVFAVFILVFGNSISVDAASTYGAPMLQSQVVTIPAFPVAEGFGANINDSILKTGTNCAFNQRGSTG